jgi:hypothetical protein
MADLGISKIATEPVDGRRVALRALAFERMPEARRGIPSHATAPIDRQSDYRGLRRSPAAAAQRSRCFSAQLAAALAGIVEPGDGDVHRAIRELQRKHFDPPETDERAQPHRRMARAR